MDILKNLMLGIVVLVVISVATIGITYSILDYQCWRTMVVLGIEYKEGDEACTVVYEYNKEQKDIREYQRLKEKYDE